MQIIHQVVDIAQSLLAIPSITPEDNGCQDVISNFLVPLGFHIERLNYGDTHNLWAVKGNEEPLLLFAGHTDVVPPGPESKWQFPPFSATVAGDCLYGRGAVDMKGGIAAMMVAVASFLKQSPDHRGSIGFLITSDEEVAAGNGTERALAHLVERGVKITWCIVGEPSSDKIIGDNIRVGRRGSLTGKLTVLGKQGHIAFPHKAINPIHQLAPALTELCQIQWDAGNADFPPTSFQCSNVSAGTGASNVIPGELQLDFNFRYSPASTIDQLKQQVGHVLDKHKLKYALDWQHGAEPFITNKNAVLVQKAIEVLSAKTGIKPALTTGGGTSDARFIAKTGCEIIELGLVNETAHKVDECTPIADLYQLTEYYVALISRLLP